MVEKAGDARMDTLHETVGRGATLDILQGFLPGKRGAPLVGAASSSGSLPGNLVPLVCCAKVCTGSPGTLSEFFLCLRGLLASNRVDEFSKVGR